MLPTWSKLRRFDPSSDVKTFQDLRMLASIGDTLVASVFTTDSEFQKTLLDATHIDRLNFGPIPTIKLNWLQPHEGSIIDFLFRARAFQKA